MSQSHLLGAVLVASLLVAACAGQAHPAPAAATPGAGTWQKVLTAEGEITGVAMDGRGNIYVAEVNKDQIEKFGRDGKRLARWGQPGSAPGQLSRPAKVALDALGNVYVTEPTEGSRGNDRIQKFSPDGVPLAQWGTHGSGPGQFDHPVGIALDRQGNIYVVDRDNSRVQKLSPDGQPLAQWGSRGTSPGELNLPYDIAVDAGGYVYVSDVYNSRIQKFSATGQPLAQWGRAGSGPGEFTQLRGVLVDAQGYIYVGDTGNNRIQKLSPKGDFVAQWAGPRQELCCFGVHTEIAMDAQGSLYASVVKTVVKVAVT